MTSIFLIGYMKTKYLLFLLALLLFIPLAQASTVCDGELCLKYNKTISNSDLGSGIIYALDTNDTSSTIPNNFYLYNPGSSNIKVYDSDFNYLYQISLSASASNAFTTFNDGAEKFLLWYDTYGSSNDEWRIYDITGSLLQQKTVTTTMGGCDYSSYFWCVGNTNNLYLYKLNSTYDIIDSCSKERSKSGDLWHFNTEDKILYLKYDSTSGKNIYISLIDNSCTEKSTINLNDFSEISVKDLTGIVGNKDDNKIWVYESSGSGSVQDKIYELDIVSASSSETTITAIYPPDDSIVYDNNIVIRLNLNAGENGTLNCYLNDTLKYTNSYTAGDSEEIRFDSGTLSSGYYNLFCNYTDIYSGYWTSGIISFNVDLGLGAKVGNFWGELLGFKDDSYSTAEEKGLAFFSLLLCIILSIFPLLLIAGESKLKIEGSAVGYIFMGLFLAWLFLFTYIGWLPVLIGVVIILIVLLLLSGMFLKIGKAS